MEKIASFISHATLFRGLPESEVERLARISRTCTYKRGETIFTEGTPADGLYILYLGRIKIYKLSPAGKEQILHIIEPGEPFGEVPVFLGTTFPAFAEALEESKALFFPRDEFVSLIREDPFLAMNMLAILSQRLRYFARLIEDLSLKEVPQRFAAYLLSGSEETGREYVHLEIGKGQLASLLGTIPETLSRILGKMAQEGLIGVEGRKITLVDKKGLEGVASGKRPLL